MNKNENLESNFSWILRACKVVLPKNDEDVFVHNASESKDICRKKSQKVEKLKSMFPKKQNLHIMPKRYNQQFIVRDAWTERHRKSAIPFMQRMLNQEDRKRKEILRKIDNVVPVNNGLYNSLSLRQ